MSAHRSRYLNYRHATSELGRTRREQYQVGVLISKTDNRCGRGRKLGAANCTRRALWNHKTSNGDCNIYDQRTGVKVPSKFDTSNHFSTSRKPPHLPSTSYLQSTTCRIFTLHPFIGTLGEQSWQIYCNLDCSLEIFITLA